MAEPTKLTPISLDSLPDAPKEVMSNLPQLSSGKGAPDDSLMDIAGEASNVINKALIGVAGLPGDLELLGQLALNWVTDGGYKVEENILPTSDKLKGIAKEWGIIDQDYQLPETPEGARMMGMAETIGTGAALGGLGAAKAGTSLARGALTGAGAAGGSMAGASIGERVMGKDSVAGPILGGLAGAFAGGALGAKGYDIARRVGAIPGPLTPTAQQFKDLYDVGPKEAMVNTIAKHGSGASHFENSMSYFPGSAQKMRDRAAIVVDKIENGMNKAFSGSTERIANKEMGAAIINVERASKNSVKELGRTLYNPLTKEFGETVIKPERLATSLLSSGKDPAVADHISRVIKGSVSKDALAGMDFDSAKRLKGVLASQASKLAKRGDGMARFYAEASKALADDIDDAAQKISPQLAAKAKAANAAFKTELNKDISTWKNLYKEGMPPEQLASRVVAGLDKGGTQFEKVLSRAQELNPRTAKQLVDYAVQRAGIDSTGNFSFSQWIDKMNTWEREGVFKVLDKYNKDTTGLINMFRTTAKEAMDIQSIAQGTRIPTQYNIIKLLVDTTAGNTIYKLMYNKPVMSLLSRAAAEKMSWGQVIGGLAVIQAQNPEIRDEIKEISDSIRNFSKQGPRY